MNTLKFITENYTINLNGLETNCIYNKEKGEVEVCFKGMTPDGIKEEIRTFTSYPGLWLVRPIWSKNKLEYYFDRVQ